MPGNRLSEEALRKFSESVFRLSDLSGFNDRSQFNLNGLMVRILTAIDGKKNMNRICDDTRIPLGLLYEPLARLVSLKLAEVIKKKTRILDDSFFDTLTATLARFLGPISAVLIDEAVADLKLTRRHFPANRVAELIVALSGEIKQKEKRLVFQKDMMKFLNSKGYLKGAKTE